MKKIHLKILTPSKIFLEEDVEYIEVKAPHSVLGILPGHAPLISTLEIAPLKLKVNGTTYYYASSNGLINVRKDETLILVGSIERVDEIDLERAIRAKERAEERLARAKIDETIDVARTKASLLRATNRINLINEYRK